MTALADVPLLLDRAAAHLPMSMNSPKARLMLVVIGLQESGFTTRVQRTNDPNVAGPARSYWQFERGGGVRGVMRHEATSGHARNVCDAQGVPWDAMAIWQAMGRDDTLGCCFARLLLYSDPRPLPEIQAVDDAWAYYERNWRPGKPHPAKWPTYHLQARRLLGLQNG